MFDLSNTNTQQTMSSLDFLNNIINPAREGCGEKAVRANDFLSRIIDELDLNESFVKVFKPAIGRPSGYVELSLEQMTLVGMRESKAVRRSVLETLKKLQKPKQELNLNDPKQLLGLLQNYAERTLELEHKVVVQEEVIAISSQQLEEAGPKVEFVNKYVEASGLLGFREVAKMLSVKEAVLRTWLIDTGAMYCLGSGWAFKAQWLDAKRGVHKTSYTVYGRAIVSAKFTPKGFAYIAERISK